jgi:hypothetical protein
MGCGGMDWIDLAQDQWRALVTELDFARVLM